MSERIQKLIANAGYGSRRWAERLIEQERITVNNKLAILGEKIDITDIVTIDGRKIRLDRYNEEQTKIIILNKQAGYVCSANDEKDRANVFELLPKHSRWIMIGRLDINTSGLLLFTNNGDLAHKMMHPSSDIDREYSVRVLGNVTKDDLEKLKNGIELEDGFAKFHSIEIGGGEGANSWFKVVLKEGRKREVRRLWEALGFTVSRLIRVRMDDIRLPQDLRANKTIELKPAQVESLLKKFKINIQTKSVN